MGSDDGNGEIAVEGDYNNIDDVRRIERYFECLTFEGDTLEEI